MVFQRKNAALINKNTQYGTVGLNGADAMSHAVEARSVDQEPVRMKISVI